MTAFLQAPDPAVVTEPAGRFDLGHWLAAAHAPWLLDDSRWSQAEAQRWRALLARGGAPGGPPRYALLTDRGVDSALREAIESRLRLPVAWTRCPANAVDHWLASAQQGFRALDALAGDDPGPAAADPSVGDDLSLASLHGQASPLLRLLDATLFDALRDGASDVHFECTARGLAIRVRLDGVMAEVRRVDGAAVAEQLVSRLKVMAELDIGERRLPQDGRFQLRVDGRAIDFRLSVMPSIHGEDAVVRVLDRAQVVRQGRGAEAMAGERTASDRAAPGGGLTLETLGFDAPDRARIRALAAQPYGMLLVTGPTGSGKTTTLYAALSEIDSGRDKIVTIEDPVEYQLPGIVQIPVNEKKGLTFARGLRSLLRHDPDRVMVGEIRDTETAQIAVQAALTGHLVFTTVHANNALDVVGRFLHMGLDLHNVASALNGVLAQRLLRRICADCSVPHAVSAADIERVGLAAGADAGVPLQLRRGSGCAQCRGTGYRGRKAIAELLLLDDELRDLIAGRAPLLRVKEAARRRGLRTLREAAVAAVCAGETTLEELDRVTLAG